MKFSLFLLPSWPEQDASHQSRIFGESVEQIQYAEELGFDSVQQPHPPIYLAVSRTPASVDLAIARDLPIMAGTNTPNEDVLGIRRLYAERCAAAGKPSRLPDMPFFRVTYVAEDAQRAREEPREALTWVADLNGLRRTLTGSSEIYMDLDHWRQTRTTQPPSYESQLQTTTYFGTPDQMVEWIRYLQQEHQVHYFGVNMSYGTLQHDKVMRSMALFAREVMPKFQVP